MPALCAAVLTGVAVLQLTLTGDIDLPEPGWTGGGGRTALAPISGRPVPESLAQTSIFSPLRTAVAGDAASASLPLGGARVAGTVSIRNRSYALIQTSDGRVARLGVGGSLDGWRLLSLGSEGARFAKDGERVLVAYGAVAQQPQGDAEASEDSE